MDYVAQDENEVILIDFKSDRHAQANQLKTLYARQISIYLRCLHEMIRIKRFGPICIRLILISSSK